MDVPKKTMSGRMMMMMQAGDTKFRRPERKRQIASKLLV